MTHTAADCLTEEEVLAFASGRPSAAGRERAHRHLDVCEECQQLLNEAVRALATFRPDGEPREELAWSTTFRPGMLVGRYLIRRFIARGGMGEVYEAFDQELQERVALKTVTSTASDDPGAVRRLKAEVQLARRVSHPNVCRIYDFGIHRASGLAPIAFLTMEFVEGETLGLRLRRAGALAVAEANRLARALLRGLDAAHSAGVLHRDFKADNVILRGEGERAEPLILDFGLARGVDHLSPQSSGSGRGLVGTLAYMAPEQLEGRAFTTASDIYSFGLVWFEMLTGELPFKGRSSPALTTLERLTKPVPAPSTRNPCVSAELDAVVLACLRRQSGDRLQTAGEVLARLERAEQTRAVVQPERRAAAALAIVGLTVGVTTGVLLHRSAPAPAAPLSTLINAARSSEPSSPRVVPAPAPASVLSPASVAALAQPELMAGAPSSSGPVAGRDAPARRRNTLAASPGPKSSAPAVASARPADAGWENPFARSSRTTSAELGAVLDQPADGRAPSGNTELSESSR